MFIFIESLLTWFNGLSVKNKNSLNQIVRLCSKIIGVQLTDLSVLWKNVWSRKQNAS